MHAVITPLAVNTSNQCSSKWEKWPKTATVCRAFSSTTRSAAAPVPAFHRSSLNASRPTMRRNVAFSSPCIQRRASLRPSLSHSMLCSPHTVHSSTATAHFCSTTKQFMIFARRSLVCRCRATRISIDCWLKSSRQRQHRSAIKAAWMSIWMNFKRISCLFRAFTSHLSRTLHSSRCKTRRIAPTRSLISPMKCLRTTTLWSSAIWREANLWAVACCIEAMSCPPMRMEQFLRSKARSIFSLSTGVQLGSKLVRLLCDFHSKLSRVC